MTYSEIYNIKDPKEKLFASNARIKELKLIDSLFGMNELEDIELRNLEKLSIDAYSEWKDPQY